MAISLADIKRNTMGAPRIILYGTPGVGKTTLAAQIPNSVFIPVEDGLAGLDVPALPQPKDYSELLECIGVLANGEHNYSAVVIDSVSAIEPMLTDYVVATVPHQDKGTRVANVDAYGFHKGHKTHVPNEWRQFRAGLDVLRARGMAVILLGHSAVEKFEDPSTDPYDRYQLQINKYSEPVLYDWADAVLFMTYKVAVIGDERKRGVGTGDRKIYTSDRPSFRAKNRYRMPHEIAVPENKPEEAWAAIDSFIVATSAANAVSA
jgi:hypothetical protein